MIGSRQIAWIAIAIALGLCTAVTITVSGPATPNPAVATPVPADSLVRYRFGGAPPSGPDLGAAIHALEKRVAGSGGSALDRADLADLYLRRAQQTGDDTDYAAAAEMAQRSLDELPSPNGAALTLARVAAAHHDFGEAIRLARGVLANAPSLGALDILATSHLALGELDRAHEAADAAVRLQPGTASYLDRALVAQAQGRDADAAADFARAVRREEAGDATGSSRLRALWGRFLLRRGELDGARRLVDEALRISPRSPLALGVSGELALRRGDTDRARELFGQAFAASRQVRYLIDEARALELAGDRAAAEMLRAEVESLLRAELSSGGTGHRLDLVDVLIDRTGPGAPARRVEAVALARAEVARRPGADARFRLARALLRAGDSTAALDQIRQVTATGARDAEVHELAARLEGEAGDPARAREHRRLASALDPGGSGWRQVAIAGAEARR